MKPAIIISTYPNKKSISKIANDLVKHKLVACVNFSKISSIYSWNGEIENTTEYKDISWRCHEIYRTMQSELNGSTYTMVVEDDTEIPTGAFERLKTIIESNKKMGTVVGSVASRRLKDRNYGIPILWNYTIEQTFPRNGTKVTESRLIKEKEYGIELVGSSHMACWLTKTPLIKRIGFKWCEDGLKANDQVWGYRLNKAGYWHAVDWSVKCKHHWKYGNERGYN